MPEDKNRYIKVRNSISSGSNIIRPQCDRENVVDIVKKFPFEIRLNMVANFHIS